jgi:hypothetical protein
MNRIVESHPYQQSKKCVKFFSFFFLLIIFGGIVFYFIEFNFNDKLIQQNRRDLDALKEYLNHNVTLIKYLEKNAHLFSGNAYENNWHVTSSIFFAFTIATTVGYGSFAPSTVGGQIFVVLYAAIAIPLAGVCFVNLSNAVLEILTYILTPKISKMVAAFKHFDTDNSGCLDEEEVYAALNELNVTPSKEDFYKWFKKVDVDNSNELDLKEFQELTLLVKANVPDFKEEERKIEISFLLMTVWLLIGSLIISFIEQWSYWEGIYFAFVTLTTVGLGDYSPNTNWGSLFTIVYTLVGLGIVAIVLKLLSQFILAKMKTVYGAAKSVNVEMIKRRISKKISLNNSSTKIFYNPLYRKKSVHNNTGSYSDDRREIGVCSAETMRFAGDTIILDMGEKKEEGVE